ncbi:glycoside hydrolase family 18 protein [Apiospora marii]|uniref:Glycoside hydrolase family 18 protein n=1 Tax=Apiospora marii TaxID=335849 RepID=A0ABR1SVG8_9PEZI
MSLTTAVSRGLIATGRGAGEVSQGTIGHETTTTSNPNPPPEETPTKPLDRRPIRCFDEVDVPGHADIQSGSQNSYATELSGLRDRDMMGPGAAPITLRKTDSYGVIRLLLHLGARLQDHGGATEPWVPAGVTQSDHGVLAHSFASV